MTIESCKTLSAPYIIAITCKIIYLIRIGGNCYDINAVFIRSNMGIIITVEGEEFLGYARQMVEKYQK